MSSVTNRCMRISLVALDKTRVIAVRECLVEKKKAKTTSAHESLCSVEERTSERMQSTHGASGTSKESRAQWRKKCACHMLMGVCQPVCLRESRTKSQAAHGAHIVFPYDGCDSAQEPLLFGVSHEP